MNIISWLLLIVACSALSGVTWWACARFYGRKLGDLQRKLEKMRKAASVHAMQTRHQIAQLQRELAAHQQAREQLMAARATEALLESAARGSFSAPQLPAHGFADTQPM